MVCAFRVPCEKRGEFGDVGSNDRARVLVVDDEPIVTEVINRHLQRKGFAVDLDGDGQIGLDLARSTGPELIILDLMLSELDRLGASRTLRAQSSVPIIMLTAKGEATDEVLGLGRGADDYVVMPFSSGELVARIKAILFAVVGATLRLGAAVLGIPVSDFALLGLFLSLSGSAIIFTLPKDM